MENLTVAKVTVKPYEPNLTKSPLKSKANWLVNLPLLLLALSATLHDPAVMAESPLPPGTLRWILWGLTIAGFMIRNTGKQQVTAWGAPHETDGTVPQPNTQSVVITQKTAPGVTISSDIPENPGQTPC
jgi:hypothetical protein